MNYTPEQIAAQHDINESFVGTQANFMKMQRYEEIKTDLLKFMDTHQNVKSMSGYAPNKYEKDAILWMDLDQAAHLNNNEIAMLVDVMSKADSMGMAAVDGHIRLSFCVNNVWIK